MRVALVPLRIKPLDVEENFRRFSHTVRGFADKGVSLIVFPETTFTGYVWEEKVLRSLAETVPGPLTERISYVAETSGVFVVVGFLEREGDRFYSSALLFSPSGEIVLHHRKIEEKPPFSTGKTVPMARTPFGKVSILICGDLFSETAVSLMSGETDLLILPMARAFYGKNPDWERWYSQERGVYAGRVKELGITTFIVNALEEEDGGAFGGAMVVSVEGEVITESPHGSDTPLVFTFQAEPSA